MVVPTPNSKRNSKQMGGPDSAFRARLFLAVACLWPLFILALFAASAPRIDMQPQQQQSSSSSSLLAADANSLQNKFLNVLDRVDILGYGPTHPRVAVIVVGDHPQHLLKTVENVFLNTDMNRLFVVCVVLEGHEEDAQLVQAFHKMDQGTIPHWHGLRPDLHVVKEGNNNGDKGENDDDEDPHGTKIKLFFHPESIGIADSRDEAAQFISILIKHHEENGLKSPHEDIILLLLQQGVQLESRKWIGPVTEALIVPPPLLGEAESEVAMKMANAVTFHVEGPGKRTSFDTTFTPILSQPTTEELNVANGDSYPAPAFNGAAIAMRHGTFINLPSQDTSLEDEWAANLDLSLNLWLCADGMDTLTNLKASRPQQKLPAPLAPDMAARFAAAWMDGSTQKKFFHAYQKTYEELTYLEWETLMGKAQQTPTFTKDLFKKCRSFRWYAEHVNPDVREILEESEVMDDVPPPEEVERKEEEESADNGKDESDSEDEVAIPARRDDRNKPAQPLCKECLDIIQKAEPIDIAFVDVSGGHKEHPHKGAVDEKGDFGYVHDETALRKNPPALNYPEPDLRAACSKRDNSYKMLNERVYVDLDYDKKMQEAGKPRPKIFCFVYTIDSGHSKIPSIRETWG